MNSETRIALLAGALGALALAWWFRRDTSTKKPLHATAVHEWENEGGAIAGGSAPKADVA